MHVLLRELWERHRPSVLLVTHDVDEAIVLADRVLVLDHGRIGLDLSIDRPHPRSYRDPLLGEYRERLLNALGVTEDVTGTTARTEPGTTERPATGPDAAADDSAGHGSSAHQKEKHQ
jgi:sulfonate transport system ATP-binding protein